MNSIAQEITSEVTDQQVARLAKVEGLMKLKDAFQYDQESARETISEIIEERRETCLALGISTMLIEALLEESEKVFDAVKKDVQSAQLKAMKDG